MFAAAEAFQDIIVRLSVLRYVITANTSRGKNDLATDAEDFFAGFLNRLYGWQLVNLNATDKKNFPAIDLGDKGRRIAVQVTAQDRLEKIRNTVACFNEQGLGKKYNRLFILLLSRKPRYTDELVELQGDLQQFEVWDLDDLLARVERAIRLNEVDGTADSLLRTLDEYTRSQLPAIVRTLAASRKIGDYNLLGNLDVVIGQPPQSAQRFLAWSGIVDAHETEPALREVVQCYERLKNLSYVGTRHLLSLAVQKSLTSAEFKERIAQYEGEQLRQDSLIFYPSMVAAPFHPLAREDFWTQVRGLQVSGWAWQMVHPDFLSIQLYLPALEGNFLYYLREFLGHDVMKLRSVLVDLDFRHLD